MTYLLADSFAILESNIPIDIRSKKVEYIYESDKIKTMLEDEYSPENKKYQEKLYSSIINRGHVDFGSIPLSKGNIREYSGYHNMMDVITSIEKLAQDKKSKKNTDVDNYIKILKTAIKNIEDLHDVYEEGFRKRNNYIAILYNSMVYSCIEATTTLLYEYIEYVKHPEIGTFELNIKNTKARAGSFYFIQLKKFNDLNSGINAGNYRKTLETLSDNGTQNFFGLDTAMVVGLGAITTVVLSIIPITRELIYQFYHMKGSLSKSLELQAQFLEMNKVCVENNRLLSPEEKKKIIDKQTKIKLRLQKLSEQLRVSTVTARRAAEKDLKKDNKNYTLDNLHDEVSNGSIEWV